MTLRRSERSVNDVLYDLAISYPGNIEALAPRLGTTATKLRNRLSPAVRDMEPTLKDFSMTIDMAQSAKMDAALDPLHALAWRHGCVIIPVRDLEDISDDSILRGAVTAMQHIGDISGSLNEALDDGEITDRHMDKIEPKFRRAMTAMCSWLARVKGRMKRDAIKPRRPFFAKREEEKVGL